MENKITFKSLTGKKKVEHIWEYYRFHIIGSIIGIILIGSLVYTVTKPKPVPNDVDLVVSGLLTYDQEQMEVTEQVFKEQFNAGIELLPTDWSANSGSAATTEQVLMLRFQVRECDVIAVPQERHERFLTQPDFNMFLALDSVPELEPLIAKHKDKLITGISKEDGKEYVYGIKVDEMKHLEGVALGEDYILSIISVPKNQEQATQLLTYLME